MLAQKELISRLFEFYISLSTLLILILCLYFETSPIWSLIISYIIFLIPSFIFILKFIKSVSFHIKKSFEPYSISFYLSTFSSQIDKILLGYIAPSVLSSIQANLYFPSRSKDFFRVITNYLIQKSVFTKSNYNKKKFYFVFTLFTISIIILNIIFYLYHDYIFEILYDSNVVYNFNLFFISSIYFSLNYFVGLRLDKYLYYSSISYYSKISIILNLFSTIFLLFILKYGSVVLLYHFIIKSFLLLFIFLMNIYHEKKYCT